MQSIKEVRDSNSQSCTLRMKDKLQCIIPDLKDKRSAMAASFSLAIENSSGNVNLKGSSPHHLSCQKWILTLLPTYWKFKLTFPFLLRYVKGLFIKVVNDKSKNYMDKRDYTLYPLLQRFVLKTAIVAFFIGWPSNLK